jgi:hypothetical protein
VPPPAYPSQPAPSYPYGQPPSYPAPPAPSYPYGGQPAYPTQPPANYPYAPQPGYSSPQPAPPYPSQPPPSSYPYSPPPRKVHIPVQARNEAAQWLAVRGTPPLLLRATLQAYRELRCEKRDAACYLGDAELLAEMLARIEKP